MYSTGGGGGGARSAWHDCKASHHLQIKLVMLSQISHTLLEANSF